MCKTRITLGSCDCAGVCREQRLFPLAPLFVLRRQTKPTPAQPNPVQSGQSPPRSAQPRPAQPTSTHISEALPNPAQTNPFQTYRHSASPDVVAAPRDPSCCGIWAGFSVPGCRCGFSSGSGLRCPALGVAWLRDILWFAVCLPRPGGSIWLRPCPPPLAEPRTLCEARRGGSCSDLADLKKPRSFGCMVASVRTIMICRAWCSCCRSGGHVAAIACARIPSRDMIVCFVRLEHNIFMFAVVFRIVLR